MAGGIYKVIELEPKEGEKQDELLSDFELLQRFAPALKTGKPSHSKLIQDWIHAFTTIEALQAAAGVKLEKKDSKQVFAEREQAYDQAKKDFKATKTALADALLSVLADITEEDIAEGKIHKSGTKTVGIVEHYTSKITPTPVNAILEKSAAHLPEPVVKELHTIRDANRASAEKKFGAKNDDA